MTFPIVLLLASIASTQAQADTGNSSSTPPKPATSRPEVPSAMQIVPLKYADSRELANALRAIGSPVRVVEDPHSNCLILNGPETEFHRLLEVISQLDVDARPSRSVTGEVEVVRLQYRSAPEIASRLNDIFSTGLGGQASRLRIAADSARNSLLLSGSGETISEVKRVVSTLDIQSNSIPLEFVFFRASLADSAPAQPLPDDLKGIAQELKMFGRLQLVGRLTTIAVENEHFNIRGSIGDSQQIEVEGNLMRAPSPGEIYLEIKSRLFLYRKAAPDLSTGGPKNPVAPAPSQNSSFELTTTVIAPRDSIMVVGSAPTGWEPGESAILAIKVPI